MNFDNNNPTVMEMFIEHHLGKEGYKDAVEKMGVFDMSKDYAGPQGSVMAKLIPDYICGVCIKPAAYIHDYYYSIPGTEYDKKEADRKFLLHMVELIDDYNWSKATSWYKKKKATFIAAGYYMAVRDYGRSNYKYE